MLQPGEQVGPFVVEKPIGAGAMGAVYRGTYPKTGQKIALKIMLPGAAENKNSADRFRREIDILKQLGHPNIVRILGDGKYNGQRFYAMEYIQGESLDHALSRRGRLSWEEVVQYGQQLCAALQHAHEKGVIHRDLKPSNLMILPDGTLKLTDFGIAKDLDVTQLTEANCTVGTASYMSPEQCRGERTLTSKSDLYSLGIVLYELLTGKKPFIAENVMDMFMLHVKGIPERPSRLVDVPKWLDILIVQLLEKKPDQRPRDAALVGEALADVLQKVEAGQSAGLEAAKTRRPGEKRDESDREAARALTGRKKKKKKGPDIAWYQQAWVKAVGLLLPLLLVAFVLWLVFKKPGRDSDAEADALYAKIEKRMSSGDQEQMEVAFNGPMKDYLRRFGKLDDEKARQVRAWDDDIGIALAEKDLQKTAELTKRVKLDSMDALKPAEKKAVLAVLAEKKGDLTTAKVIWKELLDEYGSDGGYWAKLAQRRLESQFGAVERLTRELQEEVKHLELHTREPQIDDATKQKAFRAWRYEPVGDAYEARARWEALRGELENKPKERTWYLLASGRIAQLDPSRSDNSVDVVKKRLKDIEKYRDNGELGKAEVLCLHLIALYSDVIPRAEFEPLVQEAKKQFDEIQKKRAGKQK